MKKRIYSLWLLGLLVWNSCLGGSAGLLMCLHMWGDAHLMNGLSSERAEDCCHEDEAFSMLLGVADDDCVDLELEGAGLLSVREDLSWNTAPVVFELPLWMDDMDRPSVVELPSQLVARAPPILAEGLRVVQCTVLRI